ncbi:sensor histidine kinase [Calorimonas adulescens]|nr:ATP-binding protein [Calorimonas adulescens]
MKDSILSRLLYTYLILFISVILILSFVFTRFIDIGYYNMKRNQLLQEGKRISSLVERYGFEDLAGNQMKDALNLIGYVTNSSVYVLKIQNLEDVGPQMSGEYSMAIAEDIKRVAAGDEVARRISIENIDTDVFFAGLPIYLNGNVEGAVLLFSPLNELGQTMDRMYMAAWGIGLAFIMIASMVIYAVSRRVTEPIIRMANAAREIADGKFAGDINIQSNDEIALLADSFNYMKNQLKKIEKMRQELISNISHELRTPLTTIRGFIQGIMDGMINPEEERQYLEVALEEVNRMTKLVGDLMDLSKLQTGSIKLYKSEFDVDSLVNEVVKGFDIECRERGIYVAAEVGEGLKVTADRDRIKQVLVNLVGNAVKFTPDGGNIVISAQQVDNRTVFKISDTGQGISEEDIPYIFDRFYRADRTKPGHGLGLAIAKELVEIHGGTISAESKEGYGTTIIFDLPS